MRGKSFLSGVHVIGADFISATEVTCTEWSDTNARNARVRSCQAVEKPSCYKAIFPTRWYPSNFLDPPSKKCKGHKKCKGRVL